MSLILDALRKMEQERKSRLGTTGSDIRPEVLRYRGTVAQPRARRPYLQGAVALALVAAGIGGGIYLKGGTTPASPEGTVAALTPTLAAPQAPATPAAPAALAAPVAPQLATQAPPVPTAPPAAQPAAPAPVTAAAPYLAVSRPGAPATSASPVTGRSARAPRALQAAQPAQANLDDPQGGADISVSGIAWQEERTLRRAVVNGALVGEGAEVAGARVVEIRETRVRFSRGGQIFDVPYSSN